MANPPNSNELIPSLIKHGKILANLLREAKTRPDEVKLKEIHRDAISLIANILSDVPSFLRRRGVKDGQLPSFFPENITIPKVLGKVQATLQELKELDTEDAFDYEKLLKKVNDYKSRHTSVVGSSSQSSTVGDSMTSRRPTDNNDSGVQVGIESCSPLEKMCLCSFCLFDAETEVKKREPIHLWVALGLVADPLQGTEMLNKLVRSGFIEHTIRNNKSCTNRYKMNQNVYKQVWEAMNPKFLSEGPLKIMQQQRQEEEQPAQRRQEYPKQQQPRLPKHLRQQQQKTMLQSFVDLLKGEDDSEGSGTLVLNQSENILQASTFQRIAEKTNNVKVLLLGSWSHNSERYIMVEEVEALKGLTKHAWELTLLSLEGISGIVKLPDFVYKLINLKVLDLKGCPNLEYLSEGIDSMKHLMHLDLSECYLLDHFPKGIASLTELRVLKGFIINREDQQEGSADGNGNRNSNSNRKQENTALSASFSELKALEKLIKLTIRTRQTNFPTNDDFNTLCAMKKLEKLKVTWVWSSTDDVPSASDSGRFPPSLKKLELQATPDNTMLRLLRLISEDAQNSLHKLYIRGGQLRVLGLEEHKIFHVKTVRLRYLVDLHINWNEFRKYFPNLTRLEVCECPNLRFFPCDENGVWEKISTTDVVS